MYHAKFRIGKKVGNVWGQQAEGGTIGGIGGNNSGFVYIGDYTVQGQERDISADIEPEGYLWRGEAGNNLWCDKEAGRNE